MYPHVTNCQGRKVGRVGSVVGTLTSSVEPSPRWSSSTGPGVGKLNRAHSVTWCVSSHLNRDDTGKSCLKDSHYFTDIKISDKTPTNNTS